MPKGAQGNLSEFKVDPACSMLQRRMKELCAIKRQRPSQDLNNEWKNFPKVSHKKRGAKRVFTPPYAEPPTFYAFR
ncbi:hypothetical protein E6C27_scaffold43437G00010 [Cucumis melo var. makuwa]|uniref:Uncharacterized protein n=1 Tax=Cucumis melo var. makuwa TaxID=1194695 RepID=A0A5A7U0F8_CUCMM|nr:hypothetical protein E6C27_scaffold43437G00010 [Cucumis melo var. makuwa]